MAWMDRRPSGDLCRAEHVRVLAKLLPTNIEGLREVRPALASLCVLRHAKVFVVARNETKVFLQVPALDDARRPRASKPNAQTPFITRSPRTLTLRPALRESSALINLQHRGQARGSRNPSPDFANALSWSSHFGAQENGRVCDLRCYGPPPSLVRHRCPREG